MRLNDSIKGWHWVLLAMHFSQNPALSHLQHDTLTRNCQMASLREELHLFSHIVLSICGFHCIEVHSRCTFVEACLLAHLQIEKE